MAVLEQMPSLEIIHGFRGVLDFYNWRGIVCVRSWPKKPKWPRSPAVMETAIAFGEASTIIANSPPLVIAMAKNANKGQNWTWRDVLTACAYGTLLEE